MKKVLLASILCLAVQFAQAASAPNILLIVADDLGYADVGFQGSKEIPTPNLDKLAKRSLRCTNGYVTHPFCSPTRAGLLTGRYQQRFGHENNPAWLPEDTKAGLPLNQTTLPQVLKTAGYTTGAVGKWHLGAHPSFHPNKRGFDEYFGALGGGHLYLPQTKGGAEYSIPLDRNGKAEPHTDYLTDMFGKEAVAFLDRNQQKPWFLYLAFNAPHTPLQATEKYLERVKGIADEKRRTYAAMICAMDEAIGLVLAKLEAQKQTDNTLIFFFSDNGGPSFANASSNVPLRGDKGQVLEGGIRVPFLVSWPAKLPKGKDYDQAVSSLDVFATATAVAGAKLPAALKLDSVNLLPFLTGEKKGAPHENLFWRTGGGASHAVRAGEWKWLRMRGEAAQLYNLKQDIGESRNVIAEQPEVAKRLEAAVMAWDKELVAPIFESPKGGGAKAKQKKQ
jgi:arylsulfatase A-like enzyme